MIITQISNGQHCKLVPASLKYKISVWFRRLCRLLRRWRGCWNNEVSCEQERLLNGKGTATEQEEEYCSQTGPENGKDIKRFVQYDLIQISHVQ